MNIYLTQSSQLGNAKIFLLHQAVSAAMKQQGNQVVNQVERADLAIVFGDSLPNNPHLVGKKVFLADAEQAFNAPENLLRQALNQAQDYVLPNPVESAVNSAAISPNSVKNIVAVTACPTGVAHTFMSAEAITEYGKKQGWNVKVETRGQVGAGNPISPEEVAAADLVFVAADIDVDLSKFVGKPMYRTSTGLALKKTAQEFDKAFKEATIYSVSRAEKAKEENISEKKVCINT